MNIRTATCLGLAALTLAGCQVAGPSATMPAPVAPQQAGVNGNWIGTDGLAISTFGNGVFTSYAVDTGARLAEGTYRMADANLVELTLTSLLRGTTSRVNCLMAGQQQLNCTAASGSQFTLNRTNMTPPPPALPGAAAQGTVPGTGAQG